MFLASIPSMVIYVNSNHENVKDLNSFFSTTSIGNVRTAMQTCNIATYSDLNTSRDDRIEVTFNLECENGQLKDISSFGQVPSQGATITCPKIRKSELESART
jgi:hypothetical protein